MLKIANSIPRCALVQTHTLQKHAQLLGRYACERELKDTKSCYVYVFKGRTENGEQAVFHAGDVVVSKHKLTNLRGLYSEHTFN